jgi:hypothetical protein
MAFVVCTGDILGELASRIWSSWVICFLGNCLCFVLLLIYVITDEQGWQM